MRYLLILFLIMAFVVGCGCSNVLTPPVAADGGMDVWPIFYGTDNSLKDNGYVVFYDQMTSAWQTPRLVATDLLPLQWTPQRNGIGWKTDGTWNVTFIEDSNDLEIWESADADWQDDAGAWARLDDDASETWRGVDVESRQNWVWAEVFEATGGISISDWYIDLAAGVPAWTVTAHARVVDNGHYSLVLDRNLYGSRHLTYIVIGNTAYSSFSDVASIGATVNVTGEYPQIIVDGEQRLWVFHTHDNELHASASFDQPLDTFWTGLPIYTATDLTDDYHATWPKLDDTIHVVLVDFNTEEINSTYLIYLRRTPNGWTAPVTLLTVDSTFEGDLDSIDYPQICVDPLGNIFVSYILNDNWSEGAGGDLQGFYLDAVDNDNYTVVGAGGWGQHLNIDQSATDVLWAIMPDSIPIAADM